MVFRVFFDMLFNLDYEVLITGSTIEEAVQKFVARYPGAFIRKVEFERELGEDE